MTTCQNIDDFTMPFGKHAGKTIAAIYATDPGYVKWVAENMQRLSIRDKFCTWLRENQTWLDRLNRIAESGARTNKPQSIGETLAQL